MLIGANAFWTNPACVPIDEDVTDFQNGARTRSTHRTPRYKQSRSYKCTQQPRPSKDTARRRICTNKSLTAHARLSYARLSYAHPGLQKSRSAHRTHAPCKQTQIVIEPSASSSPALYSRMRLSKSGGPGCLKRSRNGREAAATSAFDAAAPIPSTLSPLTSMSSPPSGMPSSYAKLPG